MNKYQYRVDAFSAYEEKQTLQEYLNERGREGWRVVDIHHPTNWVQLRIILERPGSTSS